MSKRLFVGNLDFSTTEQQLREVFSPYGTLLDVTLVTDRVTGQSRGFGFVELEDNGAADRAVQELDGSSLSGRALKVNEARERVGGGGGGGGGGRRGGPRGGGRDRR